MIVVKYFTKLLACVLIEMPGCVIRVVKRGHGLLRFPVIQKLSDLSDICKKGLARLSGCGAVRRNNKRIIQHQAADQFRIAQGQHSCHATAVRSANQVYRPQLEATNELRQILDMLGHGVIITLVIPFIGIVVSPAVTDKTILAADRRPDCLKRAHVAHTAVHEHHRRSLAIIDVMEVGKIDLDRFGCGCRLYLGQGGN